VIYKLISKIVYFTFHAGMFDPQQRHNSKNDTTMPKFHFGQKFFSIFSADTPSATRIDVISCNNNIDIERSCIRTAT